MRPLDLVRRSVRLGSPPIVYRRLVEVLEHPWSGANDLANVIRDDPGLSVRLLRLVNSAMFSFPRRISTISDAVPIVGTAQLRDLALATSVITIFDDIPEDLVDMDSFWRHSLGVGVAARLIARMRREPNVEQMFVAGLVHDVGRLILFELLPEESKACMEECRDSGVPLFEVEKDRIGFDHAQVGKTLLDLWNFPAALQEAVLFHHHPNRAARYPDEAASVHVADITVTAMGVGASGEVRVPPLEVRAWQHLGIDSESVPHLLEAFEPQYEAALELIEVGAGR